MRLKWYAAPYVIWMVVFTVAPLGLLLAYALTDAAGNFTASQFVRFFREPIFFGILLRSLWLAFLCTAICLGLGYPVAYILSRRKSGGLLSVLFILPMWMNFLLRTYAWMTILENNGLVNKLFMAVGLGQVTLLYNSNAVLFGMVYNYLPFMILPVMTVLRKMDRSLLEAAGDLGASPREAFRRVVLPLSMPGVISGVTMVFMPAVTTFVISQLLGGAQFMLFGDLIQQQYMQVPDWNFGSALSIVIMVLILASMAVMNRLGGSPQDGEGLI
jgi:spermidine/putrescine transport system permease protein